MTTETNMLANFLNKAEKAIARTRPDRVADHRAVVHHYLGYVTNAQVIIRGRVQRIQRARVTSEEDSRISNFRDIARRFFTSEIPHASVAGEFLGHRFTTTCDDEGFFTVTFDARHAIESSASRLSYAAFVVDPKTDQAIGPATTGHVISPRVPVRRIIVSDIDDTVVESGATSLPTLLKTTLFENIHTRRIFPGVGDFYRKLKAGRSGDEDHPIFYVTSSPWNLHDFITELLTLREVPEGPLFMTDWGIDPTKILKPSHSSHKLDSILRLLGDHPDASVVLLGDSGEKDPEIYLKVVNDFPDRVDAIFIRDVSDHQRDEEVRLLLESCEAHDIPVSFSNDGSEAADQACQFGLISDHTEIAPQP
ncbi:App1 family protein [Haloferula rosea]|uniref:DUF2183 domain-containing protein n=1 Tax=Haloferula rosea TaxID=490093 RepID=A0A934VE40_9BACT|nr:phosphatase domain-containing protein [Haloferula rosea]MBK1825661.1 DUF2183 domain-containing protein [Haloferula rosea]